MPSCLNVGSKEKSNPMLLHYVARVLEVVFFTGLAGSLVVAVWAFVGDFRVLLEPDEPGGVPPQS